MGASKLRPIDIGVPGSDVYGVIGTPADKCEAKIDAEWRVIGIADALGMYKGALRRCIECHGPMEAHGPYNDGARPHFAHKKAHSGCSLKSNSFSGVSSPHPDALS
jgi:hypothetical protein